MLSVLWFNRVHFKQVIFFSCNMFSIEAKPLQNETVFFHYTNIYSLSNTFLILKSDTQNVAFKLKSCTCFVLKNAWIEPKDRISFWKPYISTEILSLLSSAYIHRVDFFTKLVDNCILLQKLFWPTVRKNCSCDREKLMEFDAEGREFEIVLRSPEQFIQLH